MGPGWVNSWELLPVSISSPVDIRYHSAVSFSLYPAGTLRHSLQSTQKQLVAIRMFLAEIRILSKIDGIQAIIILSRFQEKSDRIGVLF